MLISFDLETGSMWVGKGLLGSLKKKKVLVPGGACQARQAQRRSRGLTRRPIKRHRQRPRDLVTCRLPYPIISRDSRPAFFSSCLLCDAEMRVIRRSGLRQGHFPDCLRRFPGSPPARTRPRDGGVTCHHTCTSPYCPKATMYSLCQTKLPRFRTSISRHPRRQCH